MSWILSLLLVNQTKRKTADYIVPTVSHSLTVVPAIAVMVNASNDSFPVTEENLRAHRVPAWEEHNKDYEMREIGHGRMQRDCKGGEGQSSSMSQGRDWHILVTQQEEVLDSGVLEIGE